MDIDGIIKPETWERGLGLMGGLVVAKREQGVKHPEMAKGKSLSILSDEMMSFSARAYGADLDLPDQSVLDWWTAFTIMTIDTCEILLPEKLWLTVEDVANHLASSKWAMGTRHVDHFGHDGVITHTDYWLQEVEGTQISSSDFSFGEYGVTPSMFEANIQHAIQELAKWSLTGMMVASGLWDLPSATEEELDEV